MVKKQWTKEDIEELAFLWSRGDHLNEVIEKMGVRDKGVITGAISRYGITRGNNCFIVPAIERLTQKGFFNG